ncbi:PA2778 family cysteine peptidase [Isoalcanivorax indicus]|uniref:PA2778 family cysteine peptidase n=1 Tax=Isoalcanivorax indicus TaxID=2202653 RepID=UPI0013C50DD6|nr:PA2778 family cysteine peptidase [Isoalcanivorax indicus]
MKYGAALTLLIMFAALSGCQSRAPLPDAASSSRHIDDVPFFPQDDYQCGPAALATVLGHAGVEVSATELVDEVWLPSRQGSLAMELVAAARARDRLVYPVTGSDTLFASLDAGLPVLVMQNLALPRWPQWHFAVVTGYRDDGRTVILNTDTREAHPQAWNRFVRTWARADYQGWVLPAPGTLPSFAKPLTTVQALQDLSGSAGAAAADAHWHTAAARWPDHYLVQFGYGNHLWQRRDPHAAVAAWQAAAEARPDAFAPWHNLALAYAGLGCSDASQDALLQARRASTNAELLAALEQRFADTPPVDPPPADRGATACP